jgi:hypothetical protein
MALPARQYNAVLPMYRQYCHHPRAGSQAATPCHASDAGCHQTTLQAGKDLLNKSTQHTTKCVSSTSLQLTPAAVTTSTAATGHAVTRPVSRPQNCPPKLRPPRSTCFRQLKCTCQHTHCRLSSAMPCTRKGRGIARLLDVHDEILLH